MVEVASILIPGAMLSISVLSFRLNLYLSLPLQLLIEHMQNTILNNDNFRTVGSQARDLNYLQNNKNCDKLKRNLVK